MIHVDVYERWWITLTIIMLVVFALAVGISAFVGGFVVPSPYATVNPNTLTDSGEFANPGLRELAPGKYEAYIVAQAQPWVFDPKEIRVPVGSTVTFYVSSVDVQHGFMIQDTNINVMILPGQVSKMTATFNKKGTFKFLCDEYCGVGHQNMYGSVIVE